MFCKNRRALVLNGGSSSTEGGEKMEFRYKYRRLWFYKIPLETCQSLECQRHSCLGRSTGHSTSCYWATSPTTCLETTLCRSGRLNHVGPGPNDSPRGPTVTKDTTRRVGTRSSQESDDIWRRNKGF